MRRSLAFVVLLASCIITILSISYYNTFLEIALDTASAHHGYVDKIKNDTFLESSMLVRSSGPKDLTPLQIKAAEHLKNESKPIPPQLTLGGFVHVGKTGGSTISTILRNGCNEVVPKPCKPIKVKKENETAISKLTTYYHDFKRGPREGKHSIFMKPALHEFYLFTIRDPVDRLISSYLYTHPANKEAAQFSYFKETELYNKKMEDLDGSEPKVREFYLQNIFKRSVSEKANEHIYKCFPTLNEYAALLNNPDEFTEGNWKRFVGEGSCANVAKLTVHNKVDEAMMHHLSNLSFITWNLGIGLINKTIMVVRTENLNKDWITANVYLGQPKDTIQVPHTKLKDSTKVDQPVKKMLSEENRQKLCFALKKEYNVHLSLIGQSVNLSPSDKSVSLQAARESCPWLNLTMPGPIIEVFGHDWKQWCDQDRRRCPS